MKKLLLLILGVLIALPSVARNIRYTYEGQTLYYTVISEDDKTVRTLAKGSSGGNSVSGDLVIPEEISDGENVFKVIEIGYGSFYGCSGLTSVTIPDAVTKIGLDAFNNCRSLTSVVIGNGVETIGSYAFRNCMELNKAEFASLESLCNINFVDHDSNPLYYAHHLYINGEEVTEVVVPDGIETLNNTFTKASYLTSVTIPNSVTKISKDAFYGCSSLISVNIPEGITEIGKDAFYGCSSLTSIEIPNSVTSIGELAFKHCSSLTSVAIGNAVTTIGMQAFCQCSSLTSIEIPNSVTEIGEDAFSGCSSLISVKIP